MSTTNTIIAIIAIVVLGAAWGFSEKAEAGDLYIEPSVFTLDTEAGDFRGVNLTGGVNINEYVGIRGSYMISAGDETYQSVNISLEEMYGFDLVLSLPVTDSASVYGFGGQTWLEAEASAGGYSASAEGDYTTYGIGFKFSMRESIGFFGEVKDIDGDTMLSAGLRFEL